MTTWTDRPIHLSNSPAVSRSLQTSCPVILQTQSVTAQRTECSRKKKEERSGGNGAYQIPFRTRSPTPLFSVSAYPPWYWEDDQIGGPFSQHHILRHTDGQILTHFWVSLGQMGPFDETCRAILTCVSRIAEFPGRGVHCSSRPALVGRRPLDRLRQMRWFSHARRFRKDPSCSRRSSCSLQEDAMLTNGLFLLSSCRGEFFQPLISHSSFVQAKRVSRLGMQSVDLAVALLGNLLARLL